MKYLLMVSVLLIMIGCESAIMSPQEEQGIKSETYTYTLYTDTIEKYRGEFITDTVKVNSTPDRFTGKVYWFDCEVDLQVYKDLGYITLKDHILDIDYISIYNTRQQKFRYIEITLYRSDFR